MPDDQMLLDIDVQPVIAGTGVTIQERFESFHAANPWIYRALERIVADLVAKGHERVGIRMAWEVVRWTYDRQTTDLSSPFKANDHYHSRYVRLLIADHPEWVSVFRTRELRAA